MAGEAASEPIKKSIPVTVITGTRQRLKLAFYL
jgi:hypothetical protein